MSKRLSQSDSASLGDRFIPRRSFLDADVAFQSIMSSRRPTEDTSLSHERYKQQIQRCLLGQSHRLPRRLDTMSNNDSNNGANFSNNQSDPLASNANSSTNATTQNLLRMNNLRSLSKR